MASVLLVLRALRQTVEDLAALRAHAQWRLALACKVLVAHLAPVLERLAALSAQDSGVGVLRGLLGLDLTLAALLADPPEATAAAPHLRPLAHGPVADAAAEIVITCAIPLHLVLVRTLRRLVVVGVVQLVREQASRPILALARLEELARRLAVLYVVREPASRPILALALREILAERLDVFLRLLLLLALCLGVAGRATWPFAGLAAWVALAVALAESLGLLAEGLGLLGSVALAEGLGLLVLALAFHWGCLLSVCMCVCV
mmetsp:Transcript_7341/g.19745  ORF Transcript_7341/g.19745 Transcript_7341/m.19745 type:complete len:262 (-) Transcript_7341:619-1404(-)